MIKILNSKQIRKADQSTIEQEPISSLDLMERAAKVAVDQIEITLLFEKTKQIDIVCGPGNNGGDGFAIARLLCDKGYDVKVLFIDLGVSRTKDCQLNYNRFDGEILNLREEETYEKGEILIDALFGSGLNRKISDWLSDFVALCNNHYSKVIAIDMPSGLFDDENDHRNQSVIKASQTITFQQPKLSMMFPENSIFIGTLNIVDIGLNQQFIDAIESNYSLVEKSDIKKIIRERDQFSHKGTYGHALMIAGEYGKAGAAVLSARAALRSGLGLLTVAVPSKINQILQTAVPEAMTIDSGETCFENSIQEIPKLTAVGIGPGIGTSDKTKEVLKQFILKFNQSVVYDADAINLLAADSSLLKLIKPNSIFTPHPGEFERLVGKWENDFDRLQKQIDFSKKHQSFVVLKGKYSSISTPDGRVYFNPTGNSGMATAGSGDVLTGVITSLLAQGYSPFQAVLLGVYVHGLAGDIAANRFGKISLIASDIVDHLSAAFCELTTPQEYQFLDE